RTGSAPAGLGGGSPARGRAARSPSSRQAAAGKRSVRGNVAGEQPALDDPPVPGAYQTARLLAQVRGPPSVEVLPGRRPDQVLAGQPGQLDTPALAPSARVSPARRPP